MPDTRKPCAECGKQMPRSDRQQKELCLICEFGLFEPLMEPGVIPKTNTPKANRMRVATNHSPIRNGQ